MNLDTIHKNPGDFSVLAHRNGLLLPGKNHSISSGKCANRIPLNLRRPSYRVNRKEPVEK